MANEDIRLLIEKANVKHWQIAEKLGISQSWLSVKLRHELDSEMKKRVVEIITELHDSDSSSHSSVISDDAFEQISKIVQAERKKNGL